ncbi:hypothetical protein EC988_009094, partial [Linderina pennispora]
VSNYARSAAAESKHNKSYWRCHDWIGVGPSAHSRFVDPASGRRVGTVRIPDTARWMGRCEEVGHGTAKIEVVEEDQVRQEAVVFGLRMAAGIADSRFRQLSGGLLLREYLRMDAVHALAAQGYLWLAEETSGMRVAPTEAGLAVIDSILLDILP